MNLGGVIGFAFLGWITTLLQFLMALGVLGVGVGVVYKVHPGAGLSLAGAAALNLLGSLLWQALVRVGASGGNYEAVIILASIIQTGLGFLTGVLVIVAMVALARALGQGQGRGTYR
jgi:hypothetical protein